MNDGLLNLSDKAHCLPEPSVIEVLPYFAEVGESMGIRFLVVGAIARDILFTLIHDMKTLRATKDIDLGINMENWDQYHEFVDALIGTGHFTLGKKKKGEVVYKHRIKVDLVPFGAISKDGVITWPPENEMKMNVMGFDEAYEMSLLVRLRENPVLDVRVTSLIGLTVLKIFAWRDRASITKKDADDLAFIMKNYLELGNSERIGKEHPEWLDGDYDYELAGARLLGVDLRKSLSDKTNAAILAILKSGWDKGYYHPLIEDMFGTEVDSSNFDRYLTMVEFLISELSL